jgi:uroporphyrinogen decarboxylase
MGSSQSTPKMKQKEDSKRLLGETGSLPSGSEFTGTVACVLGGERLIPPPVWLMRQAGRYLPEYRALRAKAASFLALCFDPAAAAEVTLQPVMRFDMDAAILFADILVIPYAFGRRVDFVEGDGPQLDPIDVRGVERLADSFAMDRLLPILETVRRVRRELPAEKSLIGFCGAPWTVATYMIAGRGTPDQAPALAFARAHDDAMSILVDVLANTSADYLVAQIRAGADVVQIFDTWAGVLDDDGFRRWSIEPTADIVRQVKAKEPGAKIIGFPRGVGAKRLVEYVRATGVDGVSLDASVGLDAAERLQQSVAVQGNLDPVILRAGGEQMDAAIDQIVERLSHGRFVFNLGHGVLPDTPPEHVARLVERVRRAR